MWCGVVWCSVVWCGVVWCAVVWCGGVVWIAVRCARLWCCIYNTLMYSNLYSDNCFKFHFICFFYGQHFISFSSICISICISMKPGASVEQSTGHQRAVKRPV